MLNFDFLDWSWNSFSTTFCVIICVNISRKMLIMLYSINWPNFIVWLPLFLHGYNAIISPWLLELLVNMCITIVCFTGCDVISFEINIIFLIKQVCYMTKNSRQNFKYFENEKSFGGEIKNIFYQFERTFSCQKLSQTWVCAFKLAYDVSSISYFKKVF